MRGPAKAILGARVGQAAIFEKCADLGAASNEQAAINASKQTSNK
jgi:hypothetical protein